MLTLISIELYKIFKKWRTYIGFITVAVLVILIQVSMLIQGKQYLDFLTRNLQSTFVFVGNFLNGYLISYIVLTSLTVHIPFLITLVAGDILAGEATAGTYRMLITRPISRVKLLTAKFIAAIIYTNLLILFLAVVSLGLGIILFGTGELLIIRDTIIIFAQDDIFWRFIVAYGFAALAMTTVTSLAFLFSSLVENAIGPIVSTMAVIIVFLIIGSLEVEFFENLQPYLFTTYISAWRDIFDDPVDYDLLGKSLFVLLGHTITFFGITLALFRKKDITS